MEMMVMSADQARTMMINAASEGASIAFKNSLLSTPNTSKTQEPISSEELCKRLDISKPTAWAWEKKGLIRGYHLGNRKYFIWEEVISALVNTKQAKS